MGLLDAPASDYRGRTLAVFDPMRDLPNVLAWFDASTLTGSNGSNVTLWPASFGGFSLNVTPTNKPTLLTNAANGKNAVRFVPTSYLLNSDTIGAGGLGLVSGWAQPISYSFAFRLSADFAAAANATLLGSTNINVNIGSAGLSLYGNAGSASNKTGPALNDGQWHVGIFNFGTAGASCYIDGYLVSASSSQLGTGALSGLYVGPGANLTAPSAGTIDVAEVIVANSVLSPSRADVLTQILAKKWGIS
jgi:hypothetical protein